MRLDQPSRRGKWLPVRRVLALLVAVCLTAVSVGMLVTAPSAELDGAELECSSTLAILLRGEPVGSALERARCRDAAAQAVASACGALALALAEWLYRRRRNDVARRNHDLHGAAPSASYSLKEAADRLGCSRLWLSKMFDIDPEKKAIPAAGVQREIEILLHASRLRRLGRFIAQFPGED